MVQESAYPIPLRKLKEEKMLFCLSLNDDAVGVSEVDGRISFRPFGSGVWKMNLGNHVLLILLFSEILQHINRTHHQVSMDMDISLDKI